MHNINFYDPSLRFRRDWTGAEAASALLMVVAGAVVAAGFWVRLDATALQATALAAATARQTKQVAVTAEEQHSGMTADAALERRLLALQATLERRQAALKLLGDGTWREDSGYSAALLALARQSIDGLWLTGVAMDHGSMTLRGRTFRPELIAVYVGRLNGEAALRGQAFRALEVRRPVEDAATAGAAADAPPVPQPVPTATRRLAPYVEFSLTGGRDNDTEPAAGAGAVSAGAAAPVGSRS